MTTSDTPAVLPPEAVTSTSRTFYLIRIGFSVVWIVAVFALLSDVTVASGPSAIAAILLVIYPLWDVAATLIGLRRTRGLEPATLAYVNAATGVAAAVGLLIAILQGITPALVVFGAWAIVSGLIQFVVAFVRRRDSGTQWPLLISGVMSAGVGSYFLVAASAPATHLTLVGFYAAGGALWYFIAAIMVTVTARRRG